MNTPPSLKSRLSCKRVKKNTDEVLSPNRSPSHETAPMDYEPIADQSSLYFPATQESSEELDVLWEWHSPQTRQRRKHKKQKSVDPVHSPKVPIRRHVASTQSLNNLRDELRLLQAELAVPDDEDSLRLSPQQETEIRNEPAILADVANYEADLADGFADFLDDSLDHQLLVCTQQAENNLIGTHTSPRERSIDPLDDSLNDIFNTSEPKPNKTVFPRTLSDDRFNKSPRLEFTRTKSFETSVLTQNQLEAIEKKKQEAIAKRLAKQAKPPPGPQDNKCQAGVGLSKEKLELIEKNRLAALAKRQAKKLHSLSGSGIQNNKNSHPNVYKSSSLAGPSENVIETVSGRLEIHRTKSFEEVASKVLSRQQLQEIERKQIEARAKLEAKKRAEIATSKASFSPEEIEVKRLQAQAKLLEKRRVQLLVEKNRQAAIQKLQSNKHVAPLVKRY